MRRQISSSAACKVRCHCIKSADSRIDDHWIKSPEAIGAQLGRRHSKIRIHIGGGSTAGAGTIRTPKRTTRDRREQRFHPSLKWSYVFAIVATNSNFTLLPSKARLMALQRSSNVGSSPACMPRYQTGSPSLQIAFRK